MEWLQYITQVVGNIGWVIGVVILYKTGVLNLLLKKNGESGSHVLDELEELKSNHLHEISETLKRLEEAQNRTFQKLGEISEGIVHIKAKLNGK